MAQSPPVPPLGGRRSEKRGGKARWEAPDGDGGGHRRVGGRVGGTAGLPSLAIHPATSAETPMLRGLLSRGTLGVSERRSL